MFAINRKVFAIQGKNDRVFFEFSHANQAGIRQFHSIVEIFAQQCRKVMRFKFCRKPHLQIAACD